MSGRARSASTCRSTSSAEHDYFGADRHRRQGRSKRATRVMAQAAADFGATIRRMRRRASSRSGLGPPVGWPDRISSERRRSADGQRIWPIASPRRVRRKCERSACELQLERAGADRPHPSRPGQGAAARHLLAGSLPRAINGVGRRPDHHSAARLHLSDRCRGARQRRRACRPHDPARPQDHARQRPVRYRSPTSPSSITGSSNRSSGAGTGSRPSPCRRTDRPDPAGDRRQAARRTDRGATRLAPPRLPHRPSAARSRRPRRARARSWPVVPLMIIAMVTLLMIQLQSMQRSFLVFSVAPLGSSAWSRCCSLPVRPWDSSQYWA